MTSFAQESSPLDHPSFTTHKNYVAFMRRISDNLTLKHNNHLSGKMIISEAAKNKIQLVKLTVKNLEMEERMVRQYSEYAQVAISWMPVKAYYMVFNLTLLLEYLISTDAGYLTTSHTSSLRQFRSLIKSGELEFSHRFFNEVNTGKEIEEMKVGKYENLRALTLTRRKQVLRKLADYAKDDIRRRDKAVKLNKRQMEEFRGRKFILSDLFYWYRIKVNYRDLEFLSAKVHPSEFRGFYNDYYLLTRNFYRAYVECINKVSVYRVDSKL